jgi:hypothetical protein
VVREFEEYILFDKDVLKFENMKRKEELEKELFESTYYKSIAREVVRKRNKVQKEIKDL